MNTKSLFAAGSLVSLFALVACSGADGADVAGDPGNHATPPPSASVSTPPSDAPSNSNNNNNNASSSGSTSSGGPVVGADAGADANPIVTPPSITKHCLGPIATPDVCVENAQGRVGDVVDVPIYLLGSSSCSEAQEASARIIVDPALFELMNPSDVQNCRTRRFDTVPAADELVWSAFGANTAVGCVDYLQLGQRDTIKLKIKPGTPAGDYTLKLKDAGFVGDDAACQTFGAGIGGTLRVLP